MKRKGVHVVTEIKKENMNEGRTVIKRKKNRFSIIWKQLFDNSYFVNIRTSEIHLFYNLQLFYWHFLEIIWLFIFLIFYQNYIYFHTIIYENQFLKGSNNY